MKKKSLIIFLFLALLVDVPCVSLGHMCHDPFRPKDHLVLVPDKDPIRIEKGGEFRMYIENTFRSILNDVRLLVESQAFDIEVKPQVIDRLAPEERSFFLVKLKLRKGFELGNYPLRINVGARSAELKPSIERIDIVVEDKRIEHQREPEIEPQEQEKIEILPQKKPEPTVEGVLKPMEAMPQEVGELVVEVEKIPFWQKPYFYIILILFLVAIFLWRKIK